MFTAIEPLGRALRRPLAFIPKKATLPILTGPNRGLYWTVGSGTHGCWLGSYERKNAQFLLSICKPGMGVFDVGANAGYFTLLFARAVRPTGYVLAFESHPKNMAALRRNLALNNISTVVDIEAAVAAETGSAAFSGDAFMGRIAAGGERSVRTICLDEYPAPDLIKMDIEGAEVDALKGAERILSERRTAWFIETDGWQAAEDCKAIFAAHGYSVRPIGDHHIFAEPDAGLFSAAFSSSPARFDKVFGTAKRASAPRAGSSAGKVK